MRRAVCHQWLSFFFLPHLFNIPADGVPLEFCNGEGAEKTRMTPLSDGEKI